MPVHPRGRGEHSRRLALRKWSGGSSPRARGTPDDMACADAEDRFIPAGAGNTRRSRRATTGCTVHPRGRGEHFVRAGLAPFSKRFIPAGAGNTRGRTPPTQHHAVHPRGRGEHVGEPHLVAEDGGSSPRARGTLALEDVPSSSSWFIPAGAGNTWMALSRVSLASVHPRGRGVLPAARIRTNPVSLNGGVERAPPAR